MFSGYYKDPERTSASFMDGYFCTGDIVEVRENDEIVVIARRKETIKLSNGEFVQPTRLEELYSQSTWVHQIYVHADSARNYIVC